MSCNQYREAASARIDGETANIPDEQLAAHLTGCAECARWYDGAGRITRLIRIGPAEPVPDLTEAILAASGPARRRIRPGELLLRIGIAAAAISQAALWWPALAGHDGMAHSLHVSHESGVWNLALAVAIGWVAARPRYARGLLPMLGAVVAGLVAISSMDLASGAVGVGRIAEHIPAASALLLIAGLLWLRRGEPRSGDSGSAGNPTTATTTGRPTDQTGAPMRPVSPSSRSDGGQRGHRGAPAA